MSAPSGLDAVVVGAGDRGYDAYATWYLDHPDRGRVVAVADPDPGRRSRFAERYNLPANRCFASDAELFTQPQLAPLALVMTGDTYHVTPTVRALEAGYDVLLEKPVALDVAGCAALLDAAERTGNVVAVCHVYRFAHVFAALHEVVRSGALGEIVSIQLSENVAFWHYAHSYVRGHTRSSAVPWLLQKSCHDLDLLCWLAGSLPERVTSLVRPTELCEVNAPAGAPEHCSEGCPHAETCPYDAVAIYQDLRPLLGDLALHRRPYGVGPAAGALRRTRTSLRKVPVRGLQARLDWWRWPVSAVTDDHTPGGLAEALATTRWGRCAWKVGDNDQPSAQTVDVAFANGVLASFTLQSTSYRSMREFRIDGTKGSAFGMLGALEGELHHADHVTGKVRRIPIPTATDGHGGGERPLFEDVLHALRTGAPPRTSIAAAVPSHVLAYAAMEAAATGTTVDVGAFAGDVWASLSDPAGGTGRA